MKRTSLAILLLLVAGGIFWGRAAAQDKRQWDGSRTTPVHRIQLMDEYGEVIMPSYPWPLPVSVRETCGPCHDYPTVAGGFHFNSTDPTVPAGRKGEPWVWMDELTGTWLPLSYRDWEGLWNPEDLGITPWRFTQLFGRHLPGGDMSEPEDIWADPEARWHVSGAAEVNCLGCHHGSHEQDQSVWGIQMMRENFRWAATAAAGLAEVKGMGLRVPDSWDLSQGPDPDDHVYAAPPSVLYDERKFDRQSLVTLDIRHKPPDDRCLHCHSVTKAQDECWEVDADVHSLGGLSCADCHRNCLEHNIIRGYEGEAEERGQPGVANFTCEGCHLGQSRPQRIADLGGRMGAPIPEHKGLPIIHFEKMTCTACHSGPLPQQTAGRVRLSRVNRLGIHGRAQWFREEPYVYEPVYMKGADGKIGAFRLMWPAFWGRLEGDAVRPLTPDEVEPVAAGILDAQQQASAVLALLGAARTDGDTGLDGETVMITPGKVYHRTTDNLLEGSDYRGDLKTNTVAWAREVNGRLQPLVPDFDPTTDTMMLDYAFIGPMTAAGTIPDYGWTTETKSLSVGVLIRASLRGLGAPVLGAEAEPVLLNGDYLFRLTWEETLEKVEHPRGGRADLEWAWLKDGEIVPLVPDFVVRSVDRIVGTAQTFTEEQAALVLKALGESQADSKGEYVYVCAGKLFRQDGSGGLVASDHAAAAPYAWPLGHDVRGAGQSLGSKACEDCHAKDAPFFFGEVRASGPLQTTAGAVVTMRDLQGPDVQIFVRTSFFFTWLIVITMALLIAHILADLWRNHIRKKSTARG